MTTTLILGGVKSGKSLLAEQLADDSRLAVTYIATASADDSEMKQRIASHQLRRPDHWQTIEAPINLASILKQHCQPERCVLVDCLTLWLTNLLMADDKTLLTNEIDALIDVLPDLPGELIMVSNETNMGIMPLGELTRQYCDQAGVLHQRVAAMADRVILTVAGLPHFLKGQIDD
ncbi:MAG: bifunctional adenosylcobinamide kinase/adenosylcobinamide-phosphate guanylyltransferase [Gammaproteobacteria bacterium]|nr:bifunctional adenosylcobinamide kinase/adenosylcobinamide-phosphate guanylyltransferase [Gammaproteobacteria bacterium]